MGAADWVDLPDEALLERRISGLGLALEGTELEPLVRRLHEELTAKGLAFLPPCHVGDEWFVPVGVPAIFVPFFLVHDRLRRLERRMVLEVEGERPEEFMKLIRHEAGHAYAYAYGLTRRRAWQRAFGRASREETPEVWRPRPYSRAYVVHLADGYAQSDPDEDFAETFAVWLAPDSDWRARYAKWKALEKLEVVDALMASIAGAPPTHRPDYRVADHDCLRVKLKTYYARKRKQGEEAAPDFYDDDLRRLFHAAADAEGAVRASVWLRRRRRPLLSAVRRWTGERKYRADALVRRLLRRCDELALHAGPDPQTLELEVAAYVTTLVVNHLHTGHFKRRT